MCCVHESWIAPSNLHFPMIPAGEQCELFHSTDWWMGSVRCSARVCLILFVRRRGALFLYRDWPRGVRKMHINLSAGWQSANNQHMACKKKQAGGAERVEDSGAGKRCLFWFGYLCSRVLHLLINIIPRGPRRCVWETRSSDLAVIRFWGKNAGNRTRWYSNQILMKNILYGTSCL